MIDDYITGYYVRVRRKGKWQSLDIATLSPYEITAVLEYATREKLVAWVIVLAQLANEYARGGG